MLLECYSVNKYIYIQWQHTTNPKKDKNKKFTEKKAVKGKWILTNFLTWKFTCGFYEEKVNKPGYKGHKKNSINGGGGFGLTKRSCLNFYILNKNYTIMTIKYFF